MGKKNTKTDIFKFIDMNPVYPTTCWLWKGSVSDKGIPYFTYQGKKYVAYRFTYWLVHPEWDISNSREYLRHQCIDALGRHVDSPLCCRPDHALPGTHEQNMMDMMLRGRAGLTIGMISDILKMNDDFPELTHSQIAARVSYKHQHACARQTVTDILSGRRRKVLRDELDKRARKIDGDPIVETED